TVDIRLGDKAEDGSQIRHDVVLFGEDVTRIKEAFKIVKDADILIIIGTSMSVYPANGLINGISKNCEVYIINPEYYEDQL
ncbi:MAG: hypothetical protein LBM96_10875, partial [Methanobrevibacter sp.]|nr:hypothetical protein [Candidatus Methanoflexus mossambicus]